MLISVSISKCPLKRTIDISSNSFQRSLGGGHRAKPGKWPFSGTPQNQSPHSHTLSLIEMGQPVPSSRVPSLGLGGVCHCHHLLPGRLPAPPTPQLHGEPARQYRCGHLRAPRETSGDLAHLGLLHAVLPVAESGQERTSLQAALQSSCCKSPEAELHGALMSGRRCKGKPSLERLPAATSRHQPAPWARLSGWRASLSLK